MIRYLLLTGTAEQAATLARMLRLESAEWKYLHAVEQLLGCNDVTILCWGTWSEKPVWIIERYYTMARERGLPMLTVGDVK